MSSVFNGTEIGGWHTTLYCASAWLSEPAFKKAAEEHLPPVCHLSCQECAKNKSLCTCSDGWSWPSPHVREIKAFCFLWSLIRWNCLLWMAQIFSGASLGRAGWHLHCELPYLKPSGILLLYIKFEFSGEEKAPNIISFLMDKASVPGSIFPCKIVIDTLR